MDLPKLFPDETVVLNWPESGILVTTRRVRTLHRNKRTGAQRLGSLLLTDICCCAAERVKLRWLLSASLIWMALGLYFRHEAGLVAGTAAAARFMSLTWGFLMAAAAFLGLYVLIRRNTVRIHAPSGVLEWCVPLRSPISGVDVIGIIEATREEQCRAAPAPAEPAVHHCASGCGRQARYADEADAPEGERLVLLGMATVPADVAEPIEEAVRDSLESGKAEC